MDFSCYNHLDDCDEYPAKCVIENIKKFYQSFGLEYNYCAFGDEPIFLSLNNEKEIGIIINFNNIIATENVLLNTLSLLNLTEIITFSNLHKNVSCCNDLLFKIKSAEKWNENFKNAISFF